MRIPAGLSRILTEIAPERINDGTEQILDVLFKINTVLREINSIDFCNPLGYILTKAMPPGGVLEGKLLKFGTSITKFVLDGGLLSESYCQFFGAGGLFSASKLSTMAVGSNALILEI